MKLTFKATSDRSVMTVEETAQLTLSVDTSYDFSGSALSLKQIEQIFAILQNKSMPIDLNLENCKTTSSEASQKLLECLAVKNLRYSMLDLTKTVIPFSGMDAITVARQATTLFLDGSNHALELSELFRALKTDSALVALGIINIPYFNSGHAIALNELLCSQSSSESQSKIKIASIALEILDIPSKDINASAVILSEGLAKNQHLESFTINSNPIATRSLEKQKQESYAAEMKHIQKEIVPFSLSSDEFESKIEEASLKHTANKAAEAAFEKQLQSKLMRELARALTVIDESEADDDATTELQESPKHAGGLPTESLSKPWLRHRKPQPQDAAKSIVLTEELPRSKPGPGYTCGI
ncbi:MAG: hypothetical protein ABI597_04730 [Gammaproteobacteria bacterium]